MLKCINCQNTLNKTATGFSCDGCKATYTLIDGVFCFSDHDTNETDFFPEGAFDRLYRSESTNFWFRVRNIIIGNTIKKYLPVVERGGGAWSKIIEVGCGTGFVSSYLKRQGYDIDCADLSLQGLNYCRKRDAGNGYYQFNLYDAIFYEHYDGVCAFDVIEHVDDDTLVLQNMNKALKAGGFIFITVPANKKLWSEIDEFSKHKRRYNMTELKDKIEDAGFKIMRISYFMTFLFPFIYISSFRLLRHTRVSKDETETIREKSSSRLNLNPILNTIFFYIFRLETYLLKLNHINLPFGSSLLCVAEKKERLE